MNLPVEDGFQSGLSGLLASYMIPLIKSSDWDTIPLQVLEQLDLLITPVIPFHPPYINFSTCVHNAFGSTNILMIISTKLSCLSAPTSEY